MAAVGLRLKGVTVRYSLWLSFELSLPLQNYGTWNRSKSYIKSATGRRAATRWVPNGPQSVL